MCSIFAVIMYTAYRTTLHNYVDNNMYVYFLCGLVCICIHESDAELICMCFFSDVLTYCVMLQDFSCYSYVMCL